MHLVHPVRDMNPNSGKPVRIALLEAINHCGTESFVRARVPALFLVHLTPITRGALLKVFGYVNTTFPRWLWPPKLMSDHVVISQSGSGVWSIGPYDLGSVWS